MLTVASLTASSWLLVYTAAGLPYLRLWFYAGGYANFASRPYLGNSGYTGFLQGSTGSDRAWRRQGTSQRLIFPLPRTETEIAVIS